MVLKILLVKVRSSNRAILLAKGIHCNCVLLSYVRKEWFERRSALCLFAVGGYDRPESHGDGSEAQHHVRVLRHGHQRSAVQHLEHDRARHHLRSRYGKSCWEGFRWVFLCRQKPWSSSSDSVSAKWTVFLRFSPRVAKQSGHSTELWCRCKKVGDGGRCV